MSTDCKRTSADYSRMMSLFRKWVARPNHFSTLKDLVEGMVEYELAHRIKILASKSAEFPQ